MTWIIYEACATTSCGVGGRNVAAAEAEATAANNRVYVQESCGQGPGRKANETRTGTKAWGKGTRLLFGRAADVRQKRVWSEGEAEVCVCTAKTRVHGQAQPQPGGFAAERGGQVWRPGAAKNSPRSAAASVKASPSPSPKTRPCACAVHKPPRQRTAWLLGRRRRPLNPVPISHERFGSARAATPRSASHGALAHWLTRKHASLAA